MHHWTELPQSWRIGLLILALLLASSMWLWLACLDLIHGQVAAI